MRTAYHEPNKLREQVEELHAKPADLEEERPTSTGFGVGSGPEELVLDPKGWRTDDEDGHNAE